MTPRRGAAAIAAAGTITGDNARGWLHCVDRHEARTGNGAGFFNRPAITPRDRGGDLN